MKIWLSKNSEIPVREQLVAQITLGIVSGDLPTGERLPSTRELARRFQVHANTVGSAYKKLAEKNLIEFKKGSGFHVCDSNNESVADGKPTLDALAAEFFRAAQSLGFSRDEIFGAVRKRFENKTPERILVVEPDEDLRRILIEEIQTATGCAVAGTSCEEFQNASQNFVIAAMADERAKIEAVLKSDSAAARVYLTARSVAASMHGETRPQPDDLIAVASGWEPFLTLAKTVLVAAQIDGDSIVVRSTKQSDWRKGLENASLVICDALTAKKFKAADKRIRPFNLIADHSLAELRKYVGIIGN